MKKIIFIEGLPNVGKTYLINKIREMDIQNLKIVDELINPNLKDPFTDKEDIFFKNDELKINKYSEGIIIVDRGPISTLVYNQVNHIIDNNYDATYVEKWFNQFIDLYNCDDTYNYYLYNPDVYEPAIIDNKNPFGSIENLQLTHTLTIYNLTKYAKNLKVIVYKKNNLQEVINEIINQFVCS